MNHWGQVIKDWDWKTGDFKRYGKKKGYNQDDLLKVVHYAIILLGAEHYDKD